MKESDLIKQWYKEAIQGKITCFNNILNYYHTRLYAYALKICRIGQIAEDALQDAYINIFIHFKEVKEPETIFYWMLTIVKRSCWQHTKNSIANIYVTPDLLSTASIEDNLENQIENNDMNSFLWERISKLSEPLRIVVILRYFSVFNDYEYISKILGIPVGTVRSRLNEAKKQLKIIWDTTLSDMPDNIRRESEFWNHFYTEAFSTMQTDTTMRKKFNEHLLPALTVRFSNGGIKQGRNIIETELDDDIKYGTSYRVNSVFNLNQVGIIQGENINSPEYPDRCPSITTIIFYRNQDKSYHMNFHIG